MKTIDKVRYADSWEEFLRICSSEGGSSNGYSRTTETGRYVNPSYLLGYTPERKASIQLIVSTTAGGTLHSPTRDWNKVEDHVRDLWEAASKGGILFNSSSEEEIAAAQKVWASFGGPDWRPH